MKSNYDILGNHIRLIDTRNRESITDRVLGINIDKFFYAVGCKCHWYGFE